MSKAIFGPTSISSPAERPLDAQIASNVLPEEPAGNTVTISGPAILIRLNQTYRADLSGQALYEATRGVWKVGSRREHARLALAVHKGIVVEVYETDGWQPADQRSYTTSALRAETVRSRWEFDGRVAAEALRTKYVGRSVAHYFSKGAQNPIIYVNVQ